MNLNHEAPAIRRDNMAETRTKRTKEKRLRKMIRFRLPVLFRRAQEEASSESSETENCAAELDTSVASRLSGRSYRTFKLDTPAKRWMSSFARSDPRWQIMRYFHEVSQEGAALDSLSGSNFSDDPLLQVFCKASVFTVWRPTRVDAIRRMVMGQAVGKGLEIKGKSALAGNSAVSCPTCRFTKKSTSKRWGRCKKTVEPEYFLLRERREMLFMKDSSPYRTRS